MQKILFLLAVTMPILACSTFASSPTPTPPLIPSGQTPSPLPEPTDPTQLIVVNPGGTFEIVLPSNPSTGYRWQLVRELDANILQLMEQAYVEQQPVMPGSGGVEVWTFRAVNPGDTTIEVGYFPPAGGTGPDETVIFSFHIE